MPLNSVNTNVGAMVALQSLNKTNSDLQVTQSRINTGLRVSSAKDNGAIWAIAQTQKATSMSLDAVKDSLNRGKSAVDVAISAGETVSDLLSQMKSKALAASDATLDSASRTALASDFGSLRDQIAKVVTNADFNGANLIPASGTTIAALANSDGTSKLTVAAQSLALGGANVTVPAAATFTTATTAAAALALVTASITNVGAALAKLGTGSTA
ncbi:MAG: flagellin, partial [Caulobacteraceae bacterium]|nr:flagellin [Caulobacteraceae bacterium]